MRLYNGVRLVDRPCPNNVRRLDMGAIPAVIEMQRTGMLLDTTHLWKLGKRMEVEMAELNERGNEMTGYPCSFSSPDQVADLLFRKIGIRTKHKIKLTDSGKREQVDADALEIIRKEHPVIPLILEYRERAKLKDTYCDPLPRKVNRETGRLHTKISVTRTATGRLASSDPNLQNIPTRTELGAEIRRAFIPEAGNVYGSIDASQIELRVLASARRVTKMMDAFWRDADLHTETAIEVFQRDRDKLYASIKESKGHGDCSCAVCTMVAKFRKEERMPCKNVNFGIVYDISAPGLSNLIVVSGGEQSYWTEPRCEEIIYKWYGVYPEVPAGAKVQHKRADRYGLVWDDFGRTRPVPEARSALPWIRSAGLRQAGNMHIQSFAAGILKLVMAEVWDEWVRFWHKYGIKWLMQVHDELIFEGPVDVMRDFLEYCGYVMTECVQLLVPIKYGTAISEESWGHLEK